MWLSSEGCKLPWSTGCVRGSCHQHRTTTLQMTPLMRSVRCPHFAKLCFSSLFSIVLAICQNLPAFKQQQLAPIALSPVLCFFIVFNQHSFFQNTHALTLCYAGGRGHGSPLPFHCVCSTPALVGPGVCRLCQRRASWSDCGCMSGNTTHTGLLLSRCGSQIPYCQWDFSHKYSP